MRRIFSEAYKYQLWRKIWVALATAQHKAGLVTKEELADLVRHQNDIDTDRLLEIEQEIGHDVVAAIREFAEKAKIGGGKIHLGATSMDIVDNADTLRFSQALEIIKKRLDGLLEIFSAKINSYADLQCMGYTHLQPAEPTTVGYRLAFSAQDLLLDIHAYKFLKRHFLKGKGMKGAVGTRASYVEILKKSKMTAEQLDASVAKSLGLDSFLITTQVYPRKVDFWLLSFMASIAATLSKFATDVRFLQTPAVGEWSEPFGEKQVGSSAMPFKKNPVASEKICSLARYIVRLPGVALENASVSTLERTLDDSANRRIIMAEAFIGTDEILSLCTDILSGLVLNKQKIAFNLARYGPFAASESIIIEAVKRGANRQEMHETLRTISMRAWQDVQAAKPNPMKNLLVTNKNLTKYLSHAEIEKHLDVTIHVGDAPERARQMAKIIRKEMKER